MSAANPLVNRVLDRQTWRCLLLGIIVWFLHLNIVYPLDSVGCRWNWLPSEIAGMPTVRFIGIMLSILAAALLVVLIVLPWRNWRCYQTDRQLALTHTEQDRRPFMAFVTMGLNGFFLVYVLASFVAVFTLDLCAGGRI